MFLIETKFTSKCLEKFRRQNECQEIPRLRLLMIFKNSSFLISKKTGTWKFKISNVQTTKKHIKSDKNEQMPTKVSGISKNLKFSDYQTWKISFSKMVPHFLIFFEVNSWQIRGSRVHYGSKKCRKFGSSKIHLKNSGIDQESIISHFAIIKTPKYH